MTARPDPIPHEVQFEMYEACARRREENAAEKMRIFCIPWDIKYEIYKAEKAAAIKADNEKKRVMEQERVRAVEKEREVLDRQMVKPAMTFLEKLAMEDPDEAEMFMGI